MATDTIEAGLGHQRIAGAASGVSLSTTAAFVGFHQGTKHVTLIPRNFSTAVVARYAYCPYLVILKTHDALASVPTDYSQVAQDGSTATSVVVTGLPTLANGGALWIGGHVPFRGTHIDVDGANAAANNLTVHYPSGAGLTLTDISDTDNTDTGASLATDGTVTWTVPATWRLSTLREICAANAISVTSSAFGYAEDKLYWTRWTWNATMTSATAVTLDHMLGLNESTAYAEFPVGLAKQERVHMGPGRSGVSGMELLVNAGTGNMLVNCAALDGYFSVGTVS